ncbi:MAG: hypothetical protein LUD79_04735 [Oscillospiraceae bacterium]|nr:hypothetical protein [Oscillospiraceae bacterium]
MAEQRRRNAPRQKKTVHYRYDADGTAAFQPELVPEQEPPRRKRVRPKRQSRTHFRANNLENLRVRPSERIAPMSVIGIVVVVFLAAMVLQYQVRLNSLNTQVVSATNTLEELQETQAQLEAQYEQMFDMQGIESDMVNSGKMIKPSDGQQIYLELTEPDTATSFASEAGLLGKLKALLSGLTEYFS